MQANRRWLLALALALFGCEADKIPVSIDRFGRTSELTPAPEALTLHEVSFMVRMHSPEVEIMDAVQKRGLADALDQRAAQALAEVGAKPCLIEALKTSPHVLTEGEQVLYSQRKEKRDDAATATRRAQEEWQASYAANVNSQIASTEREVRERRIQELTAEISQLEKNKGRERYSPNYHSPYQGFQRKIDKAEEERISLHTLNGKPKSVSPGLQGMTDAR